MTSRTAPSTLRVTGGILLLLYERRGVSSGGESCQWKAYSSSMMVSDAILCDNPLVVRYLDSTVSTFQRLMTWRTLRPLRERPSLLTTTDVANGQRKMTDSLRGSLQPGPSSSPSSTADEADDDFRPDQRATRPQPNGNKRKQPARDRNIRKSGKDKHASSTTSFEIDRPTLLFNPDFSDGDEDEQVCEGGLAHRQETAVNQSQLEQLELEAKEATAGENPATDARDKYGRRKRLRLEEGEDHRSNGSDTKAALSAEEMPSWMRYGSHFKILQKSIQRQPRTQLRVHQIVRSH